MKSKAFFGEFFKAKRIERGITLRKFCLEHQLDPGNISKIERGVLSPPVSREKLEKYANYLKLEKGSDDYIEFFDRAAACKGEIPYEIMEDSELVKKLPIIFRTIRGEKVPSEKLDEILDLIRKA